MTRRRTSTGHFERTRLYVVLCVFALTIAALLARAVDLQLLRKDFYQSEGNARHIRTVPMPAPRGAILDRNGEPLAISTPVESIWVHPARLLENPERIAELATLLGEDEAELAQKLGRRAERSFVYLKRHAKPELVRAVHEADIPGVNLQRESRRFYPAGESAAHVVGFTNIDDQGQEGLELAYDEWLSGRDGAKRVVKDLHGRVIEEVEMVAEPAVGRSLVTSIDRNLQYMANRELQRAVREHGAESGSIVVMDVTNGEILAMVNAPTFNPNQRSKGPAAAMRNRAITDFFEPGSVVKPLTLAAALESGQYDSGTVINTAPGFIKVGTYTINDHHDFGTLNLTGILTKSSNVGMTKIALSLEAEHLWDVFQRFGLGSVTGTGFPGESPGLLPHHSRWREVEQAAASYGYGLSTTPLQLAQAYAAIANGGRLRRPTFVKDAREPDSAVMDPGLAARLLAMMETVTSEEGTGTRAAIRNYRVAGKTGTARIADQNGYGSDYTASFVGVAPASDPRLVVVVVLHKPMGDAYYGGQVAAPAFQRVMSAALRLFNIPADALDMPVTHTLAGAPQ